MVKRILIVDDHEVVRQGVRRLLQGHSEWEIVGEAQDGVDAVAKIQEYGPDLVILDISMPRKDGLEVVSEVAKLRTSCKFLMLTMHDNEGMISKLVNLGASGYVMKSQAGYTLVGAVQEILDGGQHFPAGAPPSLKVRAEKSRTRKKPGMFRIGPPLGA